MTKFGDILESSAAAAASSLSSSSSSSSHTLSKLDHSSEEVLWSNHEIIDGGITSVLALNAFSIGIVLCLFYLGRLCLPSLYARVSKKKPILRSLNATSDVKNSQKSPSSGHRQLLEELDVSTSSLYPSVYTCEYRLLKLPFGWLLSLLFRIRDSTSLRSRVGLNRVLYILFSGLCFCVCLLIFVIAIFGILPVNIIETSLNKYSYASTTLVSIPIQSNWYWVHVGSLYAVFAIVAIFIIVFSLMLYGLDLGRRYPRLPVVLVENIPRNTTEDEVFRAFAQLCGRDSIIDFDLCVDLRKRSKILEELHEIQLRLEEAQNVDANSKLRKARTAPTIFAKLFKLGEEIDIVTKLREERADLMKKLHDDDAVEARKSFGVGFLTCKTVEDSNAVIRKMLSLRKKRKRLFDLGLNAPQHHVGGGGVQAIDRATRKAMRRRRRRNNRNRRGKTRRRVASALFSSSPFTSDDEYNVADASGSAGQVINNNTTTTITKSGGRRETEHEKLVEPSEVEGTAATYRSESPPLVATASGAGSGAVVSRRKYSYGLDSELVEGGSDDEIHPSEDEDLSDGDDNGEVGMSASGKLEIKESDVVAMRKWRVHAISSPPSDIDFHSFRLSRKRRMRRKVMVYVVILIWLFFFTSPTVLLSSTKHILHAIDHKIPYTSNAWYLVPVHSLLFAWLPALLQHALTDGLPLLLERMTRFEGHTSKVEESAAVAFKMLVYSFVAFIVFPSIQSVSLDTFLNFVIQREKVKGHWWEILGNSFLSDSGAFFVNYVIELTLLGSALMLLRVGSLVLYLFRRLYIFAMAKYRTKRELKNIVDEVIEPFDLPEQYSRLLIVVSLSVIFSVGAPILSVICVLFMLFNFPVGMYNLMYVHPRESQDEMRERAVDGTFLKNQRKESVNVPLLALIIGFLLVVLLFQQFLFACFFAVRGSYLQIVTVCFLFVCTMILALFVTMIWLKMLESHRKGGIVQTKTQEMISLFNSRLRSQKESLKEKIENISSPGASSPSSSKSKTKMLPREFSDDISIEESLAKHRDSVVAVGDDSVFSSKDEEYEIEDEDDEEDLFFENSNLGEEYIRLLESGLELPNRGAGYSWLRRLEAKFGKFEDIEVHNDAMFGLDSNNDYIGDRDSNGGDDDFGGFLAENDQDILQIL